jgi:long-subunit acyl-CoA synthetase (AMP-forming)
VVCSTPNFDIWLGSSGSLISDIEVRLVSVEGKEITSYDEPGELWVNSPSVVLGYLNNENANRETFVTGEDGKRYMRTGDEAVIRKSPEGNEHIFIVDRIKELIKVKVRPFHHSHSLLKHHTNTPPHTRVSKSPPPSSKPIFSRTKP